MSAKITGKLKSMLDAQAPPARVAHQRARRESYSLLDSELEMVEALRRRALGSNRIATKSQIVRAALHVLHSLDDNHLAESLDNLPHVRTGRPPRTEP
jgi:hypothetical protein